ncbi:hypothetical protein PHLGIDRAFT_423094 [Phlebiopsis gigantea 11061_1 CR5-6]|uniref:Uncharacterized protein n=1 Tax=Phlebiopsis gigantea (strain 11061_1 CR5-6) TaxID=745531 RepID=A0A0C3PLN8_PHLG1|nr:hypothetical protein PHLGIDRAFT_423094 [Phlebiopsis gigantea 11061_1 CR5-6]
MYKALCPPTLPTALASFPSPPPPCGSTPESFNPGNILIDIFSNSMNELGGILADLSEHELQLTSRPQHTRSGTWAFRSGAALRYPLKPPYLCDDLESFVNLVNFFVLRLHYTTLTNEDTWNLPPDSILYNESLASFVQDFFYGDIKDGSYSYGDHKFSVYKDPNPPFQLQWTNNAFSWLLTRLHKLCHLHYQSLNEDTLKKYSGREQRAPRTPPPYLIREESPDALPADEDADVFSITQASVAYAPLSLEDPLAKHDNIISAFEFALDRPPLKGRWLGEKTVDQFLNLPRIKAVFDKRYSITEGNASGLKGRWADPARGRGTELEWG